MTDQVTITNTTATAIPTYRGIANVNGTSCHTSSALQLLFHCFPHLREALLNLAPISAEYYLEKEGHVHDVVQHEFVYQLSWFFYLLAYEEDALEIASAARLVDLKAELLATKSKEGKDAATETVEDEVVTALSRKKSPTEQQAEEYDASSEFRSLLATAAARPPRKEQERPSGPTRKSHRHDAKESPSSPDSRASRKSRRSKSNNRHHNHNKPPPSSSSSHHAPSRRESRENEGPLKKPSEMNPIQRAAITAFMTRARLGQSSTEDWTRLVSVMKEDNRTQYNEALGMVLQKRESDEGNTANNGVGGEGLEQFNEGAGSTTVMGNLGGGRPTTTTTSDTTMDEQNPTSASSSSIDPTSFYQHLESYTAQLEKNTSGSNLINTNNVGDAAMVFRCLVNALEYSIQNELERLETVLDILEIDDWNNKEEEIKFQSFEEEFYGTTIGNKLEEEEGISNDGTEKIPSEKQLKASLIAIQQAISHEWSGTLISRLVGTSTSVKSNVHNPMIPHSSSITSTTTLQRTKKIGTIERPLPIPFPLPVVRQNIGKHCVQNGNGIGNNHPIMGMTVIGSKPKTKKEKNALKTNGSGDDQGRYFGNLEEALHSVTIEPNPIRGYDWRGLMKRGEVLEQTFVKKVDGDGNEIVDEIVENENENDDEKKEENDELELNRNLSKESGLLENDDIFLNDVDNAMENVKKYSIEGKDHTIIDDGTEDDEVKNSATTREESNSVGEAANKLSSLDVNNDDVSVLSNAINNDDVSVLSTTSKSIACQADSGYEISTQTDYNENDSVSGRFRIIEVSRPKKKEKEEEDLESEKSKKEAESKQEIESEIKEWVQAKNESKDKTASESDGIGVRSTSSRSRQLAIEKDSCYSAAVAALTRSSPRGKGTSVASRHTSRSSRGRVRGTSVDIESRGRHVKRGTSVESDRDRVRGTSVDGRHSFSSRQRGTSVGSPGQYRGTSVDGSRDIFRDASVDRHSLRASSLDRRAIITPGNGNNPPDATNTDPVTISYKTSPDNFSSLPGITTPSGMEVGPSPTATPRQQGITVSYMPSMGIGMLPSDSDSDDSSSSEEESSVDSHVSSVDTDSVSDVDSGKGSGRVRGGDDNISFSTHSSAIDTPPDIDDLSLGSFTDDSLSDAEEKKDEDNVILLDDDKDKLPEEEALAAAPKEDIKADEEVVKEDPKGMEVAPSESSTSYSAVTDSNSDNSSSSSSSSNSSSGSSSSSSSSSSATSSTDSSSSSTGDSSDDDDDDGTSSSSSSENFTNAVSAAIPSADDEYNENKSPHHNNHNATHLHNKKNEWITRKETRLAQHPSLPQSLIFHLKRFEYSPTLGRVEKLSGVVDVPEVLDVKNCCLVSPDDEKKKEVCCYRYRLSGAIVHVDPMEKEEEVEFGEASEGHYVTFISSSAPTPSSAATTNSADDSKEDDPQDKKKDVSVWTEIDDEFVRTVDSPSGDTSDDHQHTALKILSGCNNVVSNNVEKTSSSADSSTKTKEKERRYATLVVYSRDCQCNN